MMNVGLNPGILMKKKEEEIYINNFSHKMFSCRHNIYKREEDKEFKKKGSKIK